MANGKGNPAGLDFPVGLPARYIGEQDSIDATVDAGGGRERMMQRAYAVSVIAHTDELDVSAKTSGVYGR